MDLTGGVSSTRPPGRVPPAGAIPAALTMLCLGLAFAQRPGLAYDDTRIELAADPGLFLHRVTSVWSNTFDLGHVQSGQFVGYLFPMAPFYALAQAIGAPTWIAQRVWLGTLMALAAWGAVRLVDELHTRRRGPAHLAAGLLYAVNPYVVIYTDRSSITLLALAALPWLLVAVHRGIAEPRRWRWPAFAGLVLAAAGGGVNAAVLAWMCLGPAALLAYEWLVLGRGRGPAWSFAWRASACALAGSLWWLVPVALQSLYGSDFLRFTEQPHDIFATTSVSESLRLLGYWVSYFSFGVGAQQPAVAAIASYLHRTPVIVASLVVPALALGGLLRTRRLAYGPFFGMLAAGTALVMAAGFPLSSPLSHALTDLYYHASPVQFLRTTYKAGPLLAISIAWLGGTALGQALTVARTRRPRVLGMRLVPWAPATLLVLPVLWAAPLFAGHAIDRPAAFSGIPGAWRQAMSTAARTTPADRRLMVLPGELFGWYRWGGTWTSIAPALTRRPVLIREITRFAEARASQLQDTVDDQIGQGRLLPGELPSLLRLLGVGEVLVAADGARARSGALDPARTAAELAAQPGFSRPLASFGGRRVAQPDPGFGGPPKTVRDLTLYPGPAAPGLVRVLPAQGPTVLDGDAQGIVELAGAGALDPARQLLYAGDTDAARLRSLTAEGARLVFTDTNRRRITVGSELQANQGVTLEASDPVPREQATYGLFAGRGTDAQTVAQYSGVRYLRAPESAGFGVHPQNRAFAAFDGDVNTAWVTDAQSPSDRYLELGLERAIRTRAIFVHAHADGAGTVTQLGVTVNGAAEHVVRLRPGWTRIDLLGISMRSLRLRVARVEGSIFPGLGGLDEVRIPGVDLRESMRMPTLLAAATRRLDLSHDPIDIIVRRETSDFPFRPRAASRELQSEDETTMADPERSIDRLGTLPVGRTFAISGWATASPGAPDHRLDELAGTTSGWRLDSSGRFEGVPGQRASSAFDGDPATAWAAPQDADHPRPWLGWVTPATISVAALRLRPGPAEFRYPAAVSISADGVSSGPVVVGKDGEVHLPMTLSGRRWRLTVLAVRSPASGVLRARRVPALAIGEVVLPGVAPPVRRAAATTAVRSACGEVVARVGGRAAPMRAVGTVGDLDAGRPLRLRGCAAPSLNEGAFHLVAGPGRVLRPDELVLDAAAPSPVPAPTPPRLLAPGGGDDTHRSAIELSSSGPGWLELAESYSRGWRAWCRDARGHERALGAPIPAQGFANAWLLSPGCIAARVAFLPQRAADLSYVLSAAALVGMALVLVLTRRRRGRVLAPPRTPTLSPERADPLLRLGWLPTLGVTALALGVGAAWAWRIGIILAVIAIVLCREGVSARRLLALAAIGLAALPLMYALKAPPQNLGQNFAFSFPQQHLSASWVALVAVLCLGAGCLLDSVRISRRGGADDLPDE